MIPARSLSSTSAPLLRSLTTAPRLSTAPARIRCLQNPRSPAQCRTFLRNSRVAGRSLDGLNVHRMRNESYDWYQRRRNFMLCGGIASALATVYTAYLLYLEVTKPKKMDSGLPPEKADPFTTDGGIKRMTVLHDADGREIVPTGNSVVPSFPRLLDLAIGAETGPQKERLNGVEYTLVGLGVRTVTFIGIQVYMVGYYIATQDIAALQARLVKEVNPIATTLIASEKDTLRETLLDPVRGEQLWDTILREVRPRSVFRIVPVRDTDFHHLRDGFVRAITARSQANNAEFGDETFGAAMKEFKALFNRGKVPTSKEMLLCRDAVGRLTITYDDGKTGMGSIGRVSDERVSRLLWLNYLAGKNVASEPARKNVVDGIMEFVERPIGTVATRVI